MAKKKRSSKQVDLGRTSLGVVKAGTKAMASFHVPFVEWLVATRSWSREQAEESARMVAGFLGEVLASEPRTRVDAPAAEPIAAVLNETREAGRSLLIIGARSSLVAWVSFLRDTGRWVGSVVELEAVEAVLGMNVRTFETAPPPALEGNLRLALAARRERPAGGTRP